MPNFHEIEAVWKLLGLGQAASLKEIKSAWAFVSLSCPIATSSSTRWLKSKHPFYSGIKARKSIEYQAEGGKNEDYIICH